MRRLMIAAALLVGATSCKATITGDDLAGLYKDRKNAGKGQRSRSEFGHIALHGIAATYLANVSVQRPGRTAVPIIQREARVLTNS